jgi:hypothetical protein
LCGTASRSSRIAIEQGVLDARGHQSGGDIGVHDRHGDDAFKLVDLG